MSIGFKQNADGSWYSYKIDGKKKDSGRVDDSPPVTYSTEESKRPGRTRKQEQEDGGS